MNTSAFETKSSLRMQDMKNTQNTQPTDHLKMNGSKKNKADGKSAAEPLAVHSAHQRNESDKVREALCVAIDENEILRERVIEL